MTSAVHCATNGKRYALRRAQDGDEFTVRALVESAGMVLAPDWQEGMVAVDADDHVVGYLRVQHTSKGPHIAPVAVRPDWQGCGVGRALMNDAVQRAGAVKLVARGESAGFYRRIGSAEISFDDISDELEEDCEHCPDRVVCQPVAFIYTGEVCDG